MSGNALYTDLSGYYDLMCAGIDYQAQSNGIHRLHQIFGKGGNTHLDLACGTGPHVQHFLSFGFQSSGLDINQPMLDLAKTRCPEAAFYLQDMSSFTVNEPLDLITCFLYSIHYNADIKRLEDCLKSVHNALKTGGIFCFNGVDKNKIDNKLFVRHSTKQNESDFTFSSGWHYSGKGEQQQLKLKIEKTTANKTQVWKDEHPMVAFSFPELKKRLQPYFEVHTFEHDYEKILPLNESSGNAVFVCIKN
ncbi:MAG: class I SAM-dependent methyltransferase [Pseudomonadaceae bacterium]|nr:class I SAM-dependent methyltransferase [Pseudomonadaceae bacterium]